jgi:hypothetical protein
MKKHESTNYAVCLPISKQDHPVSNRIEATNIPAGARIRTGAPAERPQAAIDALIKLFSERQNVISARLGLMEILHPDGTSEFTYTIGVQCSSDEQATIQQAVEVLQSAPAGRWPISIFPPTNQYFTKDAIVFFGQANKGRSWLARLLNRN